MRRVLLGFAIISISILTGIVLLTLTAQDAYPVAANSCLSIPACALQEKDNNVDFNSGFTISNNTGSGFYYAPVYLPNGAKIRKIILYCKDNSANFNIDLWLYRQHSDSSNYQIAELHTTGSSSGWRTFKTYSISPRTVNIFIYSYFVMIQIPGTSTYYEISQVKILYDVP